MLLRDALISAVLSEDAVLVRRHWEFEYVKLGSRVGDTLVRCTESPDSVRECTFVPTLKELVVDDWEVFIRQ